MAQPPTDTSKCIKHGRRIRLACLNCEREDFDGVDALPDDWTKTELTGEAVVRIPRGEVSRLNRERLRRGRMFTRRPRRVVLSRLDLAVVLQRGAPPEFSEHAENGDEHQKQGDDLDQHARQRPKRANAARSSTSAMASPTIEAPRRPRSGRFIT